MALRLTPVDKKNLPKSVSTQRTESNTLPPKGVFAKFEALGKVSWGSQIRGFPGGYVAVVDVENGRRRLALLGEKEKTARLVEHLDAASWAIADLRDGATLLLQDRRGEAEGYRGLYYEVALPSGEARCVYDGPPCAVRLGPPGYLVDQGETFVRLIKTDGGQGHEVSRREWRKLQTQTTHFATAGGRVQLVFSQSPFEIVALGVYGDELRVIAMLAERFVSRFIGAEGRVFLRSNDRFSEVHGLAEAYEAGAAGEVTQQGLAPGELGFAFVDLHDFAVPEKVDLLSALRFERDDVLPCEGGYVTLLHYSRKHHAVAIVDGLTLAVRMVEPPRGEAAALRVEETGKRALFWGGEPRVLLEIDIPTGKVQSLKLPDGLGTDEEALFDFAADGRLVMATMGGVRLFELTADHRLVEAARADIAFAHSLATIDAGRVVAVDCTRTDGKKAVAVFGIYRDTFRLLGEVQRPRAPGRAADVPEPAPTAWLGPSSWRRIGKRLFTGILEWNELQGAAETYARGESEPGLPLAALQYVPPAPATTTKNASPRPTPLLDKLIAQIEARAVRKAPHPVLATLLAGKLPADLRRLFSAMAGHEVKWESLTNTDFELSDDLLAVGIETDHDGFRADLVIVAGDGGGNLYAIDKDDERAGLLFLDHEDGFADRHVASSIEELLAERLREARERGDDDDAEEEEEEAQVEAPKPRRLVCTEDGANKFWEGAIEGTALTVRWGKVGTAGQTKTKTLASSEAAQKELDKLIKEKLAKGYVDG